MSVISCQGNVNLLYPIPMKSLGLSLYTHEFINIFT